MPVPPQPHRSPSTTAASRRETPPPDRERLRPRDRGRARRRPLRGRYRGWMSEQEGEDGYDLVEWIAAQPWCDGNVGMVGVSYFGTIQLHVAAEQPPHLKAIMPWNARRRLLPRGDAPRRHPPDLLLRALHSLDRAAARSRSTREEHAARESTRLRRGAQGRPRPADVPDALERARQPGHELRRSSTCCMHPLDGPFYWERSAYAAYDRIRIPVLHALRLVGLRAHAPARGRSGNYLGIDAPQKLEIERQVGRGARRSRRATTRRSCAGTTTGSRAIDTGVDGRAADPPLADGRRTSGASSTSGRSRGPSGRRSTCGAGAGLAPEPETDVGHARLRSCSSRVDETSQVAALAYETQPLADATSR